MTTFPHFCLACLALAFSFVPFRLMAQETDVAAFEGYGPFKWGTSLEEVKRLAGGEADAVEALNPESWNADDVAAYTGFSMGPQAFRLRYTGENGEATDYFVVQDRLCMVIRTPNSQDMFRPRRVIREVETLYDAPIWKSEKSDLPLPTAWGILAPPHEVLLSLQWENERARVRMAIKAWKPSEMRQVYRIVYMSRTLSDENLGRLAEFRRKEAEEAARKKAEAEAAAERKRAAEAAARAATPAP
jgi:hypothetical protein